MRVCMWVSGSDSVLEESCALYPEAGGFGVNHPTIVEPASPAHLGRRSSQTLDTLG